ncbi:MAG: PQQ-binding-like beta-propeller repeat protein [Phycisphaeraceae bacterium]
MKNSLPIGPVLVLLCVAWCSDALADWPQWRGPTRDGVVGEVEWPKTLSDEVLKPVWRVGLAEGYPGPVISDGRVFTVETLDAKDEVVRAFDLKTGEQLWKQRWPGAMKVPFFAKRNGSWIKATPACDGERLYVMGMLDVLVCLDAKTGEKLWSVDFKERYGTNGPMFGQPCSPLIDGDAVYVQAGLSVCKLDKMTGKTIWRSMHDARDFIGGNFSSPVIDTVAGKRQLLVQTRGELAGIDLGTGGVLWRQGIKAFRGMNILPPTVVGDDHVFTSSYGGGSFLFKVTAGDDGSFAVNRVWSDEKLEGYMSSPLVIDGHLYLHGRDKKFRCIDVMTGGVKWTSEKEYGEYWSSVRNGDKVLALDHDGTLRLIEATPTEFRIAAEHKIAKAETWAHVALDDDLLFIRELNALAVYRWAPPGGLD